MVIASGLPVFSLSIAIISSARDSNASAIFRRAFWRSAGVESRQDSKAIEAALMAWSTSAAFDIGAVAYGFPVTGLMSSLTLPDLLSKATPLTKFLSCFMVLLLSA